MGTPALQAAGAALGGRELAPRALAAAGSRVARVADADRRAAGAALLDRRLAADHQRWGTHSAGTGARVQRGRARLRRQRVPAGVDRRPGVHVRHRPGLADGQQRRLRRPHADVRRRCRRRLVELDQVRLPPRPAPSELQLQDRPAPRRPRLLRQRHGRRRAPARQGRRAPDPSARRARLPGAVRLLRRLLGRCRRQLRRRRPRARPRVGTPSRRQPVAVDAGARADRRARLASPRSGHVDVLRAARRGRPATPASTSACRAGRRSLPQQRDASRSSKPQASPVATATSPACSTPAR